jgi:hypothetical protein
MREAKSLILPALSGTILLFFSCFGAPAAAPVPVYAPPIAAQKPFVDIFAHQYSTLGQAVPDWVVRYLNAGIPGVEALSRFADSYVFVDENSGTNINALNQWSEGFVPAQDFSRLVSARVQSRFIGKTGRTPDRDYGRYFEAAVRAASDRSYAGAKVEGKFWVVRQFIQDSETNRSQKIYDYYILISIKKEELKTQLNDVFRNAITDLKLTREQNGAINRLRDAFYDTF